MLHYSITVLIALFCKEKQFIYSINDITHKDVYFSQLKSATILFT